MRIALSEINPAAGNRGPVLFPELAVTGGVEAITQAIARYPG